MKFSYLFCILFGGIIASCGADKKIFDNPLDPQCEAKDKSNCSTVLGAETETTTTTATTGPGAPTSSGAGGGIVTSRTGILAGSAYNFASSFSVTPTGCDSVGAVKVFENGRGVRIFVSANCGQRSQLYSYTATLAGVADASPVQISNSCISGTVGVRSFDVEKSDTNYVVV